MTSQNDLLSLGEQLLSLAQKAGAQDVDVLVTRGHSVSIDVREGALERADRAESSDIGLRVIVDGRQACVSSSDTSRATLEALAERAVAMAREAPQDPYTGLAEASALSAKRDGEGLDLHDDSPEPAPETLFEMARAAEAAGLAVKGITRPDATTAGWGRRESALIASNGFAAANRRTGAHLSTVLIAGEGTEMERDWAAESRIYLADLPDPASIGRLAAERTLARLDARKPPSGAYPVLYDERVAASLISHLGGAINGGTVARGSSWLREAMGEQVLPRGFDLREEPHRPRIGGSRYYDAEGLPTEERLWVEDGVLKGWVLDLASARKLEMESTANATRGLTSPPSPSMGNVTLSAGRQTRDDLIREMGTGLLITSMIGSTINPTTGDYSRGAAGLWVENGEIRYAVHECTVAGNLREMLLSLRAANDARDWYGTRVPSLLVEGLTIAGA